MTTNSHPEQATPAFTPGPWIVEGFNPPMVYARSGCDIIAQCDSVGEMLDEQEQANARLISASPDLFQACRAAESFIVDSGFNGAAQLVAQIRAALTKALNA